MGAWMHVGGKEGGNEGGSPKPKRGESTTCGLINAVWRLWVGL